MQCVSPDDADVLVQDPGVLQMHPQDCASVGLSENVVFWEAASLHKDPPKSLITCGGGPIQAGWNALGPRVFGCSGQGARGQEIKAVNPCSAVFPADARDELYLHTWGRAPSHANGCATTAHFPSPAAASLLPFVQADVLSSTGLCTWLQDFRSSDGVKWQGSSNGAMHFTNEGLRDRK